MFDNNNTYNPKTYKMCYYYKLIKPQYKRPSCLKAFKIRKVLQVTLFKVWLITFNFRWKFEVAITAHKRCFWKEFLEVFPPSFIPPSTLAKKTRARFSIDLSSIFAVYDVQKRKNSRKQPVWGRHNIMYVLFGGLELYWINAESFPSQWNRTTFLT